MKKGSGPFSERYVLNRLERYNDVKYHSKFTQRDVPIF
jgi:hypothetical protein